MEIRFVSSLAPDDETRLAAAIVDVVTTLLDILPLEYSLVVETAAGKTLERCGSPSHPIGLPGEPPRRREPRGRRAALVP